MVRRFFRIFLYGFFVSLAAHSAEPMVFDDDTCFMSSLNAFPVYNTKITLHTDPNTFLEHIGGKITVQLVTNCYYDPYSKTSYTKTVDANDKYVETHLPEPCELDTVFNIMKHST